MEVPRRLRELNQWICWRAEADRNGKPTKIPVNPHTGRNAKTNDPATWSDLETAKSRGPLGFVFRSGGDLFGIDLDGCVSPDGEVASWALEILERFPTYAEISPSGSGIKLYAGGRFSGTGRQKEMGDEPTNGKMPKIELYPGDKSRYFAFTGQRFGDHLEVSDCQDALDAFIAENFPARVRPQAMVVHSQASCSSAEQRAAAYLSKIDPTRCGTSTCHDRTFRAACTLVVDFCLSVSQAFPLLAAWASIGEHPWSEKELLHKLTDAEKKEGPRGKHLAEKIQNGPDVNLSKLLTSMSAIDTSHVMVAASPLGPTEQASETLEPSPEDPKEFPKECLEGIDGLIGELIEHNLATAMYPQPELALAGALALQAVISGRKITDEKGTRTNAYIMGLAPSGAGKEHARKLNIEILLRAGGDLLCGPERIASGAGLTSAVFESPSILFQLDEIGRLLSTMRNPGKSPHLYGIGTVLMQMYSKSDTIYKSDAYADLSKTKTIDQPNVVVYGTAVPESFWDNLSAENVGEGLLGRFMVFEATGYVPMQDVAKQQIPQSIIDRAAWWISMKQIGGNLSSEHPEPHIAVFDPLAKKRMNEHLKMICQKRIKEESKQAAVWSRSGEKTCKLALIFACSRAVGFPVVISLADVERAIRINNWLTRKMIRKVFDHVAENDQEAKWKRVLRILSKPMTSSELTRKTQWLRSRERDEILRDMIGSGIVAFEDIPTSGRTVRKLFRSD